MTLRCRFLGSLEIRDGAQWRPIRGVRARTLLAVLVLHRGEHVPVRRLVDEVWDGRPPASAETLVRGYVSALRRAFGTDGARIIVGHAGGYRLDLPPGAVDVDRFDALCADGRAALRRGDPEGAGFLLSEAISLHRGPAFVDVPHTRTLSAYAYGVDERRLAAVEARIEAELSFGRHIEVLGELHRLVTEHPNREGLLAQWMRALHAAGRRSEALDVYLAVHKRLVDQQGIGPGPELRGVHRSILAADETAPVAPRELLPEGPETGWTGPSQAPADLTDFTGRDAELAYCRGVLAVAEARTVRVVAISGRGGVGKSALAVALMHDLRDRYPDGQLYADLAGDTERSADPAEVLGMFLRAIGVPGIAVPERTDERAALLRSSLADRRVLIVLENALNERQVRALLPGGAGCAVIVTSRARLSVLEGAHFVELDAFTPPEALDLFERVAGAERTRGQPGAARRLLALCGHLPLAVRIMAARVASAPETSLSWFVDRVADEHRRLDELRLHDLDVRSSIGAGYALLSGVQRRLLRLLALLDVASFPGWLPALVAGLDEGAADEALRALVDQRLVDVAGVEGRAQPRYRFHTLIRLFAREQAAADPNLDPAETLERAVDGWLTLAVRANERLPAQTLAVIIGATAGARLPDEVVNRAERTPFDWFEAERESIGDLVAQSAALGRADLAWGLAAATRDFYELRDLYDDGNRVHRLALRACRDAGDTMGEAVMARNLADLYTTKPGSYLVEKLAHAERSLVLFRAAGHAEGEADALYLCATVHRTVGAADQAESCLKASLVVAQGAGYRLGEVHVWQLTGILRRQQGRPTDAIAAAYRALSIARELGSSRDESVLLGLIGLIHHDQGEPRRAASVLAEAVTIAEGTVDPVQLAILCAHLGGVYVDSGDARAEQVLSRGLALSAGCRSEFGQAMALSGLGRLAIRDGAPRRAVAHFVDAAALHRMASNRHAEAKALAGLAQAWMLAGDAATAREVGLAAMEIFSQLGNEAEADQLAVAIGLQAGGDPVEIV